MKLISKNQFYRAITYYFKRFVNQSSKASLQSFLIETLPVPKPISPFMLLPSAIIV